MNLVTTVNVHVTLDTPIDTLTSETGQYMRIGDWGGAVVVMAPEPDVLIDFFRRCFCALVDAKEQRRDRLNLDGYLTNDADPEEDLVSSLVDGEEVTDE